jgi:homoserine dehydrogenase
MLQGDAIREITLEGPGAGGLETASAVVADMVSIVGTTGTGFLQEDPVRRELEPLPPGELRSPFYLHLDVEDRPGVLAHVAAALAEHGVSVARLIQHPVNGSAALHVVTHEARSGDLAAALGEIARLPETLGAPSALPVVSDRGVPGLGWA